MNRIGSALGWSVLGLIAGAIVGAVAGFVMGVIRIENVIDAGLAGALPVGLIGAFGAFAGRLLEKATEGAESTTVITSFVGALLGALIGTIIGAAVGADIWLLESIDAIENQHIVALLMYHINLVGGPHVVVGAFLGILTVGFVDTFLGDNSTINVLIIVALLTPVVAIISALVGQIDWGTAFVIVVGTAVIYKILAKSDGDESSSTGQDAGTALKGKPKA